jgi:hypothetical protein
MISETITPKIRLHPETSARAWVLGFQPTSSISFHTRLAREGFAVGTRLMVRETVAIETLARLAISRRLIRHPAQLMQGHGQMSLEAHHQNV